MESFGFKAAPVGREYFAGSEIVEVVVVDMGEDVAVIMTWAFGFETLGLTKT